MGQWDGFSRSEKQLLESYLQTVEEEPALQSGFITGGAACKLLSDARYRPHMPMITDIDIYYPKIPAVLAPRLEKTHLVDRVRRKYSLHGLYESITYSPLSLYKYPTQHGQEIDIFEGQVGEILIPDGSAQPLETTPLQALRPGVLMATILQPRAVSEKRLKRGRYVIASAAQQPQLFHQAVADFQRTAAYNNLSTDAYDQARVQATYLFAKRTPIFVEYLNKATKH
jgi:hypothetical protein